MNASSPDNLCLHCGLCCSDVLFARVELGEQSLTRITRTRWRSVSIQLEERANHTSFPLPCGALNATGRCHCYHERPHTCARYHCRLLQRYEAQRVSREKALEKITQVKAHVTALATKLSATPADQADAPFYRRLELFRTWYQHASVEERAEWSHLLVAHNALLLTLTREFYLTEPTATR